MSTKEYDPQMHTLEHLLNGTIARRKGLDRAFSTHIEKKKSKIDFRATSGLTPIEVEEIEQEVNLALRSNADVWFEQIDALDAEQKYNLSRLPKESEVADSLRIVHVGSFDSCPCIGAHVSNTSEVEGSLKIISSDFTPESGTLRVRFKLIK